MLYLRVPLQNEWPRSGNGRLGTELLGKLLKGVFSSGKYSLSSVRPPT